MQQEIEQFLNLKTPPGRLTAEQAAWFLGFSAHEIPILIAKGLLKPLGHPAHNGQKYFLAKTLEELRRDEKWFGKASDGVTKRTERERSSRERAALPRTRGCG